MSSLSNESMPAQFTRTIPRIVKTQCEENAVPQHEGPVMEFPSGAEIERIECVVEHSGIDAVQFDVWTAFKCDEMVGRILASRRHSAVDSIEVEIGQHDLVVPVVKPPDDLPGDQRDPRAVLAFHDPVLGEVESARTLLELG